MKKKLQKSGKTFQKPLDKWRKVCYNNNTKERKERDTMMKFASEMNAIATKVQVGRETKKLNVAHAYADNDLAVEMEEIAKKGGRSMWVKKPKKVKWKYVRAYLEQNDFKVFGLFNLCRISW